MKKLLFLLLAIGCTFCMFSCTEKDDPKPDPIPVPIPVPEPINYKMPSLGTNSAIVKASLLEISDNVIETKKKGYYRLVCTPRKAETNMFSYLSYEFKTKDFNFIGLNFTYKLDESLKLTQENKDKVTNYLKELILK